MPFVVSPSVWIFVQNNNALFKPIMQKQWNFVSIELIQIAGSDRLQFYRGLQLRIEDHFGFRIFWTKFLQYIEIWNESKV